MLSNGDQIKIGDFALEAASSIDNPDEPDFATKSIRLEYGGDFMIYSDDTLKMSLTEYLPSKTFG